MCISINDYYIDIELIFKFLLDNVCLTTIHYSLIKVYFYT